VPAVACARLQVEEIDNLLHLSAMLEFLAPRAGQPVQRSRDELFFSKWCRPDMMLVEHHSYDGNSARFWKVRPMPREGARSD